jgi:hypothetical protein
MIHTSSSLLTKEGAVPWMTLSEWCTSPATGLRLHTANSTGPSITSSVRRLGTIDQLTLLQE